jgi:hypothetical protein
MAETAREYLIHRFRGDAHVLRERTASLQRGSKIPGPDAATSARMADACDHVVQLLEQLGQHDDVESELAALVSLIPLLEERARAAGQLPPVRAVFAGAATRIREVETAEAKARDGVSGDDADDEANDDDDDA